MPPAQCGQPLIIPTQTATQYRDTYIEALPVHCGHLLLVPLGAWPLYTGLSLCYKHRPFRTILFLRNVLNYHGHAQSQIPHNL